MSQTIQNFYCSNCQGDRYYEDREGNIICSYCGTQSQDYIAESHEAGEEGMIYAQNLGRSVRRHTATGGNQRKGKKRIQSEPDLLEYLTVYQYFLQMMGNSTFQLLFINVSLEEERRPLIAPYLSLLKELWIQYLKAWQTSNTACQLSFLFSMQRNKQQSCKCKKLQHPLYPSKQLLLAFVYLILRINRSDIIIPDLLRWIERGLIPYYNLWDVLPETMKVLIPLGFRKPLIGAMKVPSAMNIWFHTCKLAEDLGIVMPPLNSPLIGFSMIKSLGLPEEVNKNYAKLSQLFTTGQSIEEVTMEKGKRISSSSSSIYNEQHYHEYIMGIIALSCMMSNHWMKWNYQLISDNDYLLLDPSSSFRRNQAPDGEEETFMRDGEEDQRNESLNHNERFCSIPMISHENHLNSFLTRNKLLTYLTQLHRLIPCDHNERQSNEGGIFIKEYLEECFSSLTTEERKSLKHLITHYISKENKVSSLFLTQQMIFEDHLESDDDDKNGNEAEEDLAYLNASRGNSEKSGKNKSKRKSTDRRTGEEGQQAEESKNIYLTCIRSRITGTDQTGHHFVQYSILIERLAKHLYLSPMLLHLIVESFDVKIMEIALYGKATSSSAQYDDSIYRNQIKTDYESQVTEDDKSRFKNVSHGSSYIPVNQMKEYQHFMSYRKTSESNFHIISKLLERNEGVEGAEEVVEEEEEDDEVFGQGRKKITRKNVLKKRMRKRVKELGLYKNDEEDWWDEKKKREQRIVEEQEQLENEVFGEDEEFDAHDDLFGVKQEETGVFMSDGEYENEDLFGSDDDDINVGVAGFTVKTENIDEAKLEIEDEEDDMFDNEDNEDENETEMEFIPSSTRPRFVFR
jgi:hypothetical protein